MKPSEIENIYRLKESGQTREVINENNVVHI